MAPLERARMGHGGLAANGGGQSLFPSPPPLRFGGNSSRRQKALPSAILRGATAAALRLR